MAFSGWIGWYPHDLGRLFATLPLCGQRQETVQWSAGMASHQMGHQMGQQSLHISHYNLGLSDILRAKPFKSS